MIVAGNYLGIIYGKRTASQQYEHSQREEQTDKKTRKFHISPVIMVPGRDFYYSL